MDLRGRQAQAACCVRGDGQENLKVGVTELHEQLGMSEEAGVSSRKVAQQAMNENGQKIFEIFGQGEEEVCCQSDQMERAVERSG